MSRSTIGGVVGAVIGFVVSGYNPQGAYWGWVIGSGVGALTDNTKTYGPRAGDASQQTSQDGSVCTYGYAEFPTTGVILWRDERREHQEEEGKGGPSAVSFRYTWSYAIGVCAGPIGAFLIIKRNGTIVYDLRTDDQLRIIGYTEKQIAEVRAAQTKFEQTFKLYYGDDEQMPDPTMQAIKGVNNVPAYRGRAYIVGTDDDVTNDGAAIPQWEFVVAQCGHKQVPNHILVTGTPIVEGAPSFSVALINEAFPLTFVGIPRDTGADIDGGSPAVWGNTWGVIGKDGEGRMSTDNRATWQPFTMDRPSNGYLAPGPHGWVMIGPRSPPVGYDLTAVASPLSAGFSSYAFTALPAYTHGEECYMVTRSGDYYWFDVGAQGYLCRSVALDGEVELLNSRTVFNAYNDVRVSGVADIVYAVGVNGLQAQLRRSSDGGFTFPEILIDVPTSGPYPVQIEVGIRKNGDATILVLGVGSSFVWTSEDGFVTPRATGIASDSNGKIPLSANHGKGRQLGFCPQNETFYIISGGNTGSPLVADRCVSTKFGLEFSEPVPHGLSNAIGMAIGQKRQEINGIPIPDAPGHYVDPRTGALIGAVDEGVKPCDIQLSEVITSQCALRNVTRIFTTQLDDHIVRGFRVATQTSPKDNIRSLQGSYFFDASDHDGYIHFLKRPQPDTFFISKDDLVADGNKPIEWELTKENDLLRKVSISYFDPMTNYAITSQDWERAITTIKAQGEGVFESALTATKDFMKQMAEKSINVAWAEKDQAKLTVRLNHAARFTGEWGKMEDEHGQIHVVRITRIENAGIVRHITLRKTRRSAYQSRAIGVSSPLPSFPGSNVRGPNISAVMNMPVLRVDDDKAGVYWAVCGLMTGWSGSTLELSRDDATTWGMGPTSATACTMGELVEPLAYAPRYGRDDINELVVQLFANAPKTPSSVTDEQILAEANPAALVYPSGKVELLQYKTALALGDGLFVLTGLMRGCKDTTPGEHEAGAIFVMLDENVKFVAIRPDDVGKTLSFRSTSSGTDPDAADVDTMTFDTIESLREWQPYNVVVTPDGLGGYCVEWIGRARLGSSRTPTHSQWFDGYRVTFTIGTVVYTVDTTAQAACLDAATMLAEFGEGYGAPQVAVRARSKVATNDDDFDSDPVPAPGTGYEGEPIAFSGSFPDAYVGIPYILYNGDNGIAVSGGGYDANAYGFIVPGVLVSGDNALSAGFRAIGIPHTAGTLDCNVHIDGTSSTGTPWTGEIDIVQSVTTAAKPAYSPIDLTFRQAYGATLVATTPPWSTFDMTGSYSLHSYGFTSGKRWGCFTVGASTYPVFVGINAAKGDLTPADSSVSIGYLRPECASVQTTGAGEYRAEIDCATGDWEVFKNGASMTTGTLALPSGNQYRFVCSNENVQDVTVKGNFGIETPAYSPTATYAGVPTPTITIPCGLEAPSPRITAMMMTGDGYRGVFRGYKRNTGDIHVAMGGLGKSSGQWRVALGGGQRQGICVASYDRADGLLGAPGTDDSVGWNGSTLYWCLSGVAGSVALPMPYGALVPIWALDGDADTLRVCADAVGGVVVLHTLSLPAGLTWFPAENDAFPSCTITYNPAGPAGYSDWSLTV